MPTPTPSSLIGEPLQMPRSLWADTAINAPPLRPLESDASADVLVIGAGFTGLAAAIQLTEGGRSCIVVDAAEPGWGASGRNNGQVIAGLKQDPDVIEQRFPGDIGQRLVQFGAQAPAEVFALIKRLGIRCSASQRGWIQPAFSRTGIRAVKARHAAWSRRGVAVRLLEGAELATQLGTTRYQVGWLDPRGGSVQPLSYVRGLAWAAQYLGVRLYVGTHVQALLSRSGLWQAQTTGGTVRARQVIVATGAYAEHLVPGLRTSFVPVRTAQIATRPLPDTMRQAILPHGQVASDARQLLTSFRLSPDGRLVMGGSGATAGLDHSGIVPYLMRAGQDLFGELGPLQWEYQWSGYFAVTTDHLPHVHEPQRNLHIAVGCNGRGIAVSTALGGQLARRALGAAVEDLAVPVSGITGIPFHRFRGLGVQIATHYKRLQDRLG